MEQKLYYRDKKLAPGGTLVLGEKRLKGACWHGEHEAAEASQTGSPWMKRIQADKDILLVLSRD